MLGADAAESGRCWEVIVMKLEDYFDFLASDDIRLKGSRVGIESVLYDYIYREQTPELMLKRFPTLTLEQIYATILYYLHNREKVEAYLLDWLEYGRQARAEQEHNPPPVILRLRSLKAERQKAAVLMR
jgi:uncharacterized protein (DUF433 family)